MLIVFVKRLKDDLFLFGAMRNPIDDGEETRGDTNRKTPVNFSSNI